jgi:lysozyme family protein
MGGALMGKRHWSQVTRRLPRALRTTSDGITFDSASEKARWHQLQLRERAGEIMGLERQVKFPLILPNGTPVKIRSLGFPRGRLCTYRADFRYADAVTGAVTTEDYKGHDDPASRLRRAVVEAIYGIEITLTGPVRRRAMPRSAA